MPLTINVGGKVEGKSKKLSGKKGIVTKVTKESHARKFTIDWDTGGTSIESARGISKAGDITPPCKKQKRTPVSPVSPLFVESEERPGSDSDTDDDSTSETEEEREDGVQREDRNKLQDVEGYWNAHGREWVEIDHLNVDPAVNAYTGITELKWGATLEGAEKSMEYYFYLMFPMDSIPSILEYTNINLLAKKKAPSTKGEMIKWLGIRLAMAVEPRRGPLPTYWKSESDVGVVSTAANYEGRFGMKLSRFTDIRSCLQLAQEPKPQPVKDPWWPIRSFILSFNERRVKHVKPGHTIVCDECMSAWKGGDGKYKTNGCPHKTKIVRKPEGVGCELKSAADGMSGIILQLELMEGSEAQSKKPGHAEYGEGTSQLLRLCAPWRGTARTIIADSAFSSVKSLLALLDQGLYFMGMVKTATREYPKKQLLQWASGNGTGLTPNRGSHKLLQSIAPDDSKIIACVWVDKKPKTIICNRYTGHPGIPAERLRHRIDVVDGIPTTVQYTKMILRPLIVEKFFEFFSSIDVHDHYRQGSLAIEREWITHTWWHRTFGTIFGICVVDAYLAYRYESDKDFLASTEVVDFATFMDLLAHQLIHNIYVSSSISLRRRSDESASVSVAHVEDQVQHKLRSLTELHMYKENIMNGKYPQRICKYCKMKTTFYCVGCSDMENDYLVSYCGFGTSRDCYIQHLTEMGF